MYNDKCRSNLNQADKILLNEQRTNSNITHSRNVSNSSNNIFKEIFYMNFMVKIHN